MTDKDIALQICYCALRHDDADLFTAALKKYRDLCLKDKENKHKEENKIDVKQEDTNSNSNRVEVQASIVGQSYIPSEMMNHKVKNFADDLIKNGFEGTVTVEVKAHE